MCVVCISESVCGVCVCGWVCGVSEECVCVRCVSK